MNNYFGIGLDAKITLDFNNKRDEHPEKCRYSVFMHMDIKTNLFHSEKSSPSLPKNNCSLKIVVFKGDMLCKVHCFSPLLKSLEVQKR